MTKRTVKTPKVVQFKPPQANPQPPMSPQQAAQLQWFEDLKERADRDGMDNALRFAAAHLTLSFERQFRQAMADSVNIFGVLHELTALVSVAEHECHDSEIVRVLEPEDPAMYRAMLAGPISMLGDLYTMLMARARMEYGEAGQRIFAQAWGGEVKARITAMQAGDVTETEEVTS
mgnify:CR=1 FL=1